MFLLYNYIHTHGLTQLEERRVSWHYLEDTAA